MYYKTKYLTTALFLEKIKVERDIYMNNNDNVLTINGEIGKNGELIFKTNEEIDRRIRLELLSVKEHCIAFNTNQDVAIWNYMLSEDKTKIFVFDENDNTIYDGLVKDAPQSIFEYGEIFMPVSFRGLNLPDNIVTRENFYLFEKQIPNKEGKE